MANPLRGEVPLQLDGKTYRLKWATNAICEFEDLMGGGLPTLGPMATSVKALRAMVWAMLQEFHSEVSLKQVTEWFDVHGVEPFLEPVKLAMERANPDRTSGNSKDPPADAADKAGLMSSASSSSLALIQNGSGI